MISDFDREQLLKVFVIEAEEILGRFEELLLQLEQAPEAHHLLHEIFRAAHTLKGNAACLQFDDLTSFAHVVEELLERLREGDVQATTARITQLLDAVDVLRDLAARSVAGNGSLTPEQQALLSELTGLASGVEASAPRPAHDASIGAPARSARSAKTLRVGIEKLDRMLDLTGEIAIARGHVHQLIASDAERERILDTARELDRLSLDLQDLVMSARLVPIGPSLRHFQRVVRDLAGSQHKRASLVIDGGDVEVDTTVLEQLKDPITHMVRNAIDHGIEGPEDRAAAGKSPAGTIRIAAAHESGGIVIRVSDDGRGLNEVRIARRARNLGFEPDRLTRPEILGLIFEPGVSTATEITEVSGRGVGMDVVRRNVESVRGTVSVASEEGVGTTITIRLPLTLTVIEGFGVAVGDENYIIPIDAVAECMELPKEATTEGRGLLNLRGEPLPFVRIRHLFGIHTSPAARENVVVVQHERGRAGIVVDELLGGNQTVVKPMSKSLGKVPGVAGSSILGSGRVALILDVHEVVRRAADGNALNEIK